MIEYARDAFKLLSFEKFQKMKSVGALETSRNRSVSRLRRCPENLREILAVLDLIPPDFELPDVQNWMAHWASGAKGVAELERYVRVHGWLREAMQQTPDEFQQLVWEGSKRGLSNEAERTIRKFFIKGDPQTTRHRILQELLKGDDDVLDEIYMTRIDDAVREYSFIRDTQNKLRKIIEMAARRGSWLRFRFPLETSGTITVNADGVVEISHDRFAAAVAGVDATLIRECDNCKRIFWAGRKDKNSCSPACAHVLRNRRYRERYKEGFYQGANLTTKEKTNSGQRRPKARRKK